MDETQLEPSSPQKEDVIVRPFPNQKLENIQTQSLVESPREVVERELAKAAAKNEAIMRQERAENRRLKARKIAIFIFVALVGVALLGVLIWLIINVILAARTPVGKSDEIDVADGATLSTVDGYQCQTNLCSKIADVPDGRIVLRDTRYYLYDRDSKAITLTTIDEQDYNSITPFRWGSRILAVLDPETGQSALFSITDNRTLTAYGYDGFFISPDHAVYQDMGDAVGVYIVARTNDGYRLLSASTGNELIRGAHGVYEHAGFLFGYETSAERRVYTNNGSQILVAPAGSLLYTIGENIVYLSESGDDFRIFYSNGSEVEEGNLYEYISDLDNNQRVQTLNQNPDYYKIPTSRQN